MKVKNHVATESKYVAFKK